MTLTATQREALTTMAAHPPERPFVLYRTKHGPMLMRITQTWLHVPQAQVDRLVGWGLLVEQGPYWTITETGRTAVVEPVPARSGRRRAERTACVDALTITDRTSREPGPAPSSDDERR